VRADKVQKRNGTIISQFPTTALLLRLVSKYGYDGHAALAALPRAHRPWEFASDREQGDTKTGGHQSLHPAQPYAPESPSKRTTEYKLGHSPESVMEKLRPKRWSDDHKSAVFEILSLGRDTFLVAASLRLNYGTVRQHCARIRCEIERKSP
jgi:hypothetical protein